MTGIAVDVHHVTHRYGAHTVLHDVDLSIGRGTRHAVLGAAVIVTVRLLGLIAGTARPASGRIVFDGRDVTRLPLHRRARLGMGRTWQDPAVIDSLTTVDNVALALRDQRLPAARQTAVRLLETVGLHNETRTLAGHLPYGHRRALELLTAVASRPRLLILDEPSAGLDELETVDFLRRLLDDFDDTTVVLADHSHAVITAIADTVTVLDRGRHQRTGPPTATVADPPTGRSATTPASRPAPPDPAGPAVHHHPGGLEVSRLNAGYPGNHVLRNVDLHVRPGEVVAVAGYDGAGRTTLVNAVAGLTPVWPHSRIALDGVDITTLSPARRARAGLGTVPQRRLLAATLTAAEQLRIARGGGDAHAEALRIAPWLTARGQQPVHTLSGGERQMLAIACAVARAPKLLVLDEPTEGLADHVVEALQDTIRRLAERQVAILLTDTPSGRLHDAADRALILRNGKLLPE